MTTEDNEQSPFTRPGFVAAAGVVALIVVLGIVIGLVNATGDDPRSDATSPPDGTPTSAPTSAPSTSATGVGGCSLSGEVLSGTLPTAPAATWEFQGTTPYPTSAQHGPQHDARVPDGVRSCFQRSPAGAVFAAANAVAHGTGSPSSVRKWIDYFVASGPQREAMLSQEDVETIGGGVRVETAGFRLLAYDGETARVDVGVRAATEGETVYLSMVYPLVWEGSDWKLSVTDPNAPIDVAGIPDLAGYIPWGP